MPHIEAETTERDIVDQVEALLANEPPWTVEGHDACGDYLRICLVRRGPQFSCGYYVIADDDMESRREQAIKDFKDIVRGRELLRRLVEEVKQRDDLLMHMWIHSGFQNNGYWQMTTEQKALYDAIVERESKRRA